MCPRCGSPVYGMNIRYPGAYYCPVCCHLHYTNTETPDFPLTLQQFRRRSRPKALSGHKPCPVIGCVVLVPEHKNLSMCSSCVAMLSRWRKKGKKTPAPVFKNEEGKWERRR